MSGQERRKFPRFAGGTVFTGVGPDGALQGQSLDQGPGGAFLETTEPVRAESKLVLTVHDPFEREQPVALIARVVHATETPKMGVGIEWQTALCPFGVTRLKQFLDTHFHLVIDPHKTGAFAASELDRAVVYDFRFGTVEPAKSEQMEEIEQADTFYGLKVGGGFLPKAQYMEIKLVAAGGDQTSKPLRKELAMDMNACKLLERYGCGEVVTQPLSIDRGDSAGVSDEELDQWKYELKKRKKVSLPATLTLGGNQFACLLKHVVREAAFLLAEGVKPARADRVVLEVPITICDRSQNVMLVGEVTRTARDRHTRKVAVDVKIMSVDEGRNEGILEQFLLAV